MCLSSPDQSYTDRRLSIRLRLQRCHCSIHNKPEVQCDLRQFQRWANAFWLITITVSAYLSVSFLCMDVNKQSKLCIWFVMFTFGCLCIKWIDGADVKRVKNTACSFSLSAPSENKHLYILIHTVCCELFGFQQESGRNRLSWPQSINLIP